VNNSLEAGVEKTIFPGFQISKAGFHEGLWGPGCGVENHGSYVKGASPKKGTEAMQSPSDTSCDVAMQMR